ncbi:MAG: type II toxin-antitoxin system HicB family antitoxin [Aphanizomenon flos-aquae DEX188]|nr:MAG: type II toxin-antitoxin system HicB family antitoxin [Aphanizomenon flos-aquae DEX188]
MLKYVKFCNDIQHFCYLVHLPEFPWQQFHTHGKSYAEVAKHGQEVIESLIAWYQEQGESLPEPIALPEKALKVA